ncbi:MAG: Uma2 family endonuclease [Chloroflexota bacterium]|nr:MAG: Uma2 family endonuclease [Chloroflexota bacterium]
MAQAMRFTSADLELMPDDGKRREIIDGQLYASKQPGAEHQLVCGRATGALDRWSLQTGAGEAYGAPGVIFAPDDDVAPDVAWYSRERLASALDQAGHFHAAPDLVVEVLSPGAHNERRDRETKLNLYSRRGVREYWIVDWQLRQVELYRREQLLQLHLVATLLEADTLASPLLPGFALPIHDLFVRAVRP